MPKPSHHPASWGRCLVTPLQGQQRAVHKPLLHQAAELWGQDREIPPHSIPLLPPSQYLEYSCPKFSSATESLGGPGCPGLEDVGEDVAKAVR